MFERFTESARDIVVGAQCQALHRDDPRIGSEHLLLALVAGHSAAARVLAHSGLTRESIDQAVADLDRQRSGDSQNQPGGTVEADRQPLADLGIDLDQVQERIDATFGDGALDRARHRRSHHAGWRRLTRGQVRTSGTKGTRFTDEAKQALEHSLRECLRLKHHSIGAEHLALGLLAKETNRAHQVVAAHELSIADLRNQLAAAHHSTA